MFCKFEEVDGKFKCSECGLTVKKPSKTNCRKYLNLPKPERRIANFVKAVVKDVSTGMKRCSKEEVQDRMNICRECELFKMVNQNNGYCSHEDCGCSISSHQNYMNKLSWKSESCPVGKWKNLE